MREEENKRQKGKEGEDIAVEMLTQKGYTILERNYFYGKTGEIDIIALDNETGYTAFIEVKMRKNLEYGEPEYAITSKKKTQIKRLAEAYLFERNITEIDCRFDVVAILKLPETEMKIEHYINAFW
jgi:putative endonuclease